MKQSKFNIDRPTFTDEEVQNYKNFDQIISKLGTSKKNKIYKQTALFTSVILGLTVAAILLFESGNNPKDSHYQTKENNSVVYEADTAIFLEPLKGITIPYQEYTIDPNTPTQIEIPSGTVLEIPEKAFLDSKGTVITTPITLKFREFHDVVSIFAAGIPMTYDSAQNTYHFESAGMFELWAFENETKVFTNPNQLIKVSLASSQMGSNFNIYYLENNNKWTFVSKDTTKDVTNDEVTNINNYIGNNDVAYEQANISYKKALHEAMIIEPQLANNDLYAFTIDYSDDDFPELKPFKNILFEITQQNKDFDPLQAQKEWQEITLLKTDEPQLYQTVFFKKNEKMTLWVRPVFSKKELQNATLVFENLYNQYNTKNNQKLQNLLDQKKEAYARLIASQNKVIAENLNQRKIDEDASKIFDSQRKITRVFEIQNFGMWNSDCPQNLPKGVAISPLFVNEASQTDTLTFSQLYMAELNKNALYTLSGNWGIFNSTTHYNFEENTNTNAKNSNFYTKPITFNAKNKTVIWGITKNNQLAIIKPLKVSQLKKQNSTQKVAMELHNSYPKDIELLKKMLGF